MLSMLYNLILYPPVQIIEIFYMLFHKAFKNPSIAILGMSFAVTVFCLPFYIVAEKWQKTERETQKRLAPIANNIKAVFKGDERFMLLQEFYRQNNYNPIYALRGSISILIQIPFFLAAYSYLSNLEAIKNISFLFIKDLGAPDSFLQFDGFTLNILPIAMTIINICSGILYTKESPLRERMQLFIMAGIFLLLLYDSPAGLVIYWTMNNIFSLLKNIFYNLKNPKKTLYIFSCLLAAVFILYLIFISRGAQRKRILLSAALSFIFFIPLVNCFFNYVLKNYLSFFAENKKMISYLFFSGCIVLSLLIGLSIPSMVISSSPEEFCFIDNYKAPWIFLLNPLFQAAGLLFLWPAIVYLLFGKKVKTILSLFLTIFAMFSVINTFVFQGNYGNITNTLLFDSPGVLAVSRLTIIGNVLLFSSLIALFILLSKFNKARLISSVMSITICFLCAFSLYNIIIINRGYRNAVNIEKSSGGSIHQILPIFSLSKTEKNIIVLMQDRAVNGLLKPIFEEHPILEKQFDGFTLYPNTLSFAGHTLMGVPPLWGGYEYTPEEMMKNEAKSNLEKHNEALKVLPVLFTNSGFNSTVTDQSWANYSWIADLSIYNSTGVKAINTMKMYTNLWFMEHDTGEDNITSKKIMRNTIWFSFLKIAPPFLRQFIYDESVYWSPENLGDSIVNFINSYSVLEYLPRLTTYDASVPSALFLTNECIHDSIFLQYPDYTPVAKVSNTGNGKYSASKTYHSTVAFYLKFGEYLEELKKNEVYDNTRIIVVADHGTGIEAGFSNEVPSVGGRPEMWNPLLLIKDFNSRGPMELDMTFMTNADVPVLAAEGIIPNPVNPFTKKPFGNEAKATGVMITNCTTSMPYQHPKNKFNIAKDQWFLVRDNIFDASNWDKVFK